MLMSCPAFFDRERVGSLFQPDVQAAVDAGAALKLRPAKRDERRIALVLVDMQVDFIHLDGALSVPGAVEDCRRIVEWIYRHVGTISKIYLSLDSHYPLQIFFSTWWADADGRHPPPNTIISAGDLRAGRWQPLYHDEWSREYVIKLESQRRKQLMIWPFHAMVGTSGHNLSPSLYEAVSYHAAARRSQPLKLVKGSLPQTEHYSILAPEVKLPSDDPQGNLNLELLEDLQTYDLVYIAGQAKSHCVLETVNSLMRHFAGQPSVVRRLRIIEDGMSSVVVPGINFDAMADEAFGRHRAAGLTFTNTSEAIG